MSLSEEELSNLLCSNCKYTISFGPVHLTSTGNKLCGRCKIPRKETEEKFYRNFIYEELAKKHKFPCKNQERGCPVVLHPDVLKVHEGLCVYNKYGCPQNGLNNTCHWAGQMELLGQHYRDKHPQLIVSHPFTERPDISRSYARFMIFTCLNFVFLLQQKCDVLKNTLWHNVILLGPPHLAPLFKYKLVFSRHDNRAVRSHVVQPCGRYILAEDNCIKQPINNILQDIGDYDNIDFKLSVSMETVRCGPCGVLLEQGPILYTDQGADSCLHCYNTSKGPLVKECATQTDNLSTLDKQIQTDKSNVSRYVQAVVVTDHQTIQTDMLSTQDKQIPTDKKRCSECGEVSDSVVDGRCRWSQLVHRLNINNTGGIKCGNSASGCTYSHSDWDVIWKHERYLCTYDNRTCTCNEQYRGSGLLHHRTQKHCSEIPAVVNEEMATAHFTHTLGTTHNESWYKVQIRELLIYLCIYHCTDGISLKMMTDTQLVAHQHLNITCTMTSNKTNTSKLIELFHHTRYIEDWYNYIKEEDFTQIKNNNINIQFVVKLRK